MRRVDDEVSQAGRSLRADTHMLIASVLRHIARRTGRWLQPFVRVVGGVLNREALVEQWGDALRVNMHGIQARDFRDPALDFGVLSREHACVYSGEDGLLVQAVV